MSACPNPTCQDAQRHYVAVLRDRETLRAELATLRASAPAPTDATLALRALRAWEAVRDGRVVLHTPDAEGELWTARSRKPGRLFHAPDPLDAVTLALNAGEVGA